MGAISKTLDYLRRNGVKATYYAVLEELENKRKGRRLPYRYDAPEASVLEAQRLQASFLSDPPRFSVLTPAYRTKPEFLRELLDSLEAQTYPYWELILADAGGDDGVKETLKAWEKEAGKEGRSVLREEEPPIGTSASVNSPRAAVHEPQEEARGFQAKTIRYIPLAKNQGISENTNAAAPYAAGDYITLLDHDDLLTPDALFETARAVLVGREAGNPPKLIYSDEDKCDETARIFHSPNKKENFNYDLLLSNNYICHLLTMNNTLFQRLKLRKEYDGAQDYDLILRAVSQEGGISEKEILHIPRILYHWRNSETSTSNNPQSKTYAYEAGKAALQAHMQSYDIKNFYVNHTPHRGFYREEYGEEIFAKRKDLAMVGGPVYDKNRIAGGIFKNGIPLYLHLRKGYSGDIHRASLQQDAFALDVRNYIIRKELAHRVSPDMDQERFAALCDALRQEGWKLLYDPEFIRGHV